MAEAKLNFVHNRGLADVLDHQFDKMTKACRAAVSDSILDTAFKSQAVMQRLVPVDTGLLKSDIQIKVRKDNNREYIVDVGPMNVRYAMYVEYGTVRTRAQPFIRPAVDECGLDGLADLQARVADAMSKAAK
jgi:HK97 gp10 family phage protein